MPLLWNISGVKFYYEPPPLEPLSPLNNVLPSPRSSFLSRKIYEKEDNLKTYWLMDLFLFVYSIVPLSRPQKYPICIISITE
jgi:hypothetical protein